MLRFLIWLESEINREYPNPIILLIFSAIVVFTILFW